MIFNVLTVAQMMRAMYDIASSVSLSLAVPSLSSSHLLMAAKRLPTRSYKRKNDISPKHLEHVAEAVRPLARR